MFQAKTHAAVRRVTAVGVALAVGWAAAPTFAAGFAVPTGNKPVRWEAEAAPADGWETVERTAANGGAYADSGGEGERTTLRFRFHAPRRMTLRLWPQWWRHGSRRPAKRFPRPLDRVVGPTALVAHEDRVFFAAPAAGRVGVVDAAAGKLEAPIDVGGYPLDLVAAAGRIYVADAARDQVAVLDPADGSVVRRISVPAEPWAVARHGGRVFVACKAARVLVAIDTESHEVVKKASLPFPPRAVKGVSRDGERRLVVRPMPVLYDPASLDAEPADRFTFYAELRDRAAFPRSLPIDHPSDFRDIEKTFYSEKAGKLQMRSRGGDGGSRFAHAAFDVTDVTEPADEADPPDARPSKKGPSVLDEVGSTLAFSAPLAGRVGLFDMAEERLVATVDAGGSVADLVAVPDAKKVYAADAAGERLVVIDTEKPDVVATVDLPGEPIAVARANGRVIVTTRDPASLVAVDVDKSRVVATAELKTAPRTMKRVKLYPSYARVGPRRWQAYPAPSFETPVRVLLRMPVLAYDAGGLDRLGPAADQPEAKIPPVQGNARNMGEQRVRAASHSRRSKVTAAGKTVRTEGASHALRVGKQWVDTSAVTDPHRVEEPARLRPGDAAGTISLTVDGGRRLDWTRNTWIAPHDGTVLVNGTDRFRRWNAPRITVEPGDHVLKVHARSRFARLDALRVTEEPPLELELAPLPRDAHGSVSLTTYSGTFARDEAVAFETRVANRSGRPIQAEVRHVVTDVAGEELARGERSVRVGADATVRRALRPDLDASGIFHLRVRVETERGTTARKVTFVKLPRLGHPRLLARAEDRPAIRERMKEHATLFRRYRDWLRWRLDSGSLLPAKDKFLASYPTPEYKNEAVNKWPVFAAQMMGWLSRGDARAYYTSRVESLLPDHRHYLTGHSYVHNAFPSIPVVLEDIRASVKESLDPAPAKRYADSLGRSPNLAQSLMAVDRPLTARMRGAVYRHGKWAANVRRYFAVHGGKRGGNWWLSTRTGCACPLQGVSRALLFCRTFFDDEALFTGTALGGLITHQLYVQPRYDKQDAFPSQISADTGSYFGSRVMRNLVPAIADHPMPPDGEKWKELVRLMGDPDAEEKRVRAEMDAQPARAAMVPLFVALGWYDPDIPDVDPKELPPTTVFEGEGEAVMASSWEPDRTRLYFTSGVRDVVYRGRPGHLELMKGGRLLLGTGGLGVDHGQPVPSWGNTVVVGKKWRSWWRTNVGHPRGMRQNLVMRRHPPAKAHYMSRDRRLAGYVAPAAGNPYYALGFHSHARHPFVREGRLVAFETSPAFDYVAGDTTNAWRPEDVRSAYRQVVFVRPDVAVIYDRVRPGPSAGAVRWVTATGPDLSVGEDNRFTVANGKARLAGRFLLPEKIRVEAIDPRKNAKYKGFRWAVSQRVLEVRPAEKERTDGDAVEFLTVLRTGSGGEPALPVTGGVEGDQAKVRLSLDGRRIVVRFAREGLPSGTIRIEGGDAEVDRKLATEVEDTYRRWKDEPRWEKWTEERRFRFMRIGDDGS